MELMSLGLISIWAAWMAQQGEGPRTGWGGAGGDVRKRWQACPGGVPHCQRSLRPGRRTTAVISRGPELLVTMGTAAFRAWQRQTPSESKTGGSRDLPRGELGPGRPREEWTWERKRPGALRSPQESPCRLPGCHDLLSSVPWPALSLLPQESRAMS